MKDIFWAITQLKKGEKIHNKNVPNSILYYKMKNDSIIMYPYEIEYHFTIDDIERTDWEIYDDYDYNISFKTIESIINSLINDYKIEMGNGVDLGVIRDLHQRWIALKQLMFLIRK